VDRGTVGGFSGKTTKIGRKTNDNGGEGGLLTGVTAQGQAVRLRCCQNKRGKVPFSSGLCGIFADLGCPGKLVADDPAGFGHG